MTDDKKDIVEEVTAVQEETIEVEKSTDKPAPEKKTASTVVVKHDELEEDEGEYSTKELELFTEMYDKTMNQIKQGDIVTGKVLDVTGSEVVIDIGFKSEGILPMEEFDNFKDVKVGDEVEVYLENVEDLHGQLILSRKRADFIRVWEKVVEKYEKNESMSGTITRRIKGGMVVNLNGVDAFLPGSQIDVKPIRDFDSYLGKELEFKIVKVNHARRNIVVSSRVLIEKEMESQRSEIIDTIEKGQVRKGLVKNITDFGVFIDLGGVDGLLHITDLSWGRVNHPSEVVKLDEEIEVVILDFNENKDRISLGRKQLMPHPWENIGDKYPIGQTVVGKVVSLTDYGAFIELETGIEGLIHISEMSWSQHIKHPSQLLHVGQDVEAKVLSIESEEKKISLGLKQLEPDPWEKIDNKYPADSKHKGIVRNLTQFGAFVELEEGIDGLVHISDLSWTKKIRHPSEVVKKGDEIDVVVLGINREERRIALGHKQVDSNPWDTFEETYKIESETSGTVSRIIDKGVIVTLPLGVDGFIPMTHLGHPKLKKAADYYKEGDEVPAKIIEFDKENKKIVLSVTNYFKDREDKELESYLTNHGVEKTTLEEMLKEPLKKEAKAKAKAETDKKPVSRDEEKPADEQVKETKAKKSPAKKTAANAETDVEAESDKKPKTKKSKAKTKEEEVKPEKTTPVKEKKTRASKAKVKDNADDDMGDVKEKA
jgi:small subunit ribosomal protein S1